MFRNSEVQRSVRALQREASKGERYGGEHRHRDARVVGAGDRVRVRDRGGDRGGDGGGDRGGDRGGHGGIPVVVAIVVV